MKSFVQDNRSNPLLGLGFAWLGPFRCLACRHLPKTQNRYENRKFVYIQDRHTFLSKVLLVYIFISFFSKTNFLTSEWKVPREIQPACPVFFFFQTRSLKIENVFFQIGKRICPN